MDSNRESDIAYRTLASSHNSCKKKKKTKTLYSLLRSGMLVLSLRKRRSSPARPEGQLETPVVGLLGPPPQYREIGHLAPSMTSLKRLQGRRQHAGKGCLMVLIWATIVMETQTASPEFIKKYFVEPIPNVTASVGRDVTLQCTVRNLDNHKVAWIKVDSQTLLTIHTRVIIKDPRIKITHNNFKQWFLHVHRVQPDDRGYYMCQINTEPMVSQQGFLDIMVPPSFVDEETSSDVVVDEMARVSLKCEAKGYPTPSIVWRREDGKEINSGSLSGRRKPVKTVEGDYLNISQATREDMGAYLCIASNGIPPSVSKRILLQVNFRPKIRVPNQLVGSALNTDVTLECILEASPRPLTSWIRSDGALLLNSKKFHLTETEDSYKIIMRLRITDLTQKDFGSYKCVGKNLLGEKEGYIRLYDVGSWRNSSKLDFGVSGTNSLLEETQGLVLDKGRRQTNVQIHIHGDATNPVQRSTESDSASNVISISIGYIIVLMAITLIV